VQGDDDETRPRPEHHGIDAVGLVPSSWHTRFANTSPRRRLTSRAAKQQRFELQKPILHQQALPLGQGLADS
jgi:hypothetical protein